MRLEKIRYSDNDFIRIRDFLVATYRNNLIQRNWLIDRWNFSRYVSQSFHKTFDTWPNTVGIWADEHGDIKAVVNSEGENRGEAFFQLSGEYFPDESLLEFIEHAEEYNKTSDAQGKLLELRVNPEARRLKKLLFERSYSLLDWREATSTLSIDDDRKVVIHYRTTGLTPSARPTPTTSRR